MTLTAADICGFNIRGGVRQGCVFSPRMATFSSVLERALSSWRAKIELERLSLEDALQLLLDLRSADDILIIAQDWTRCGFCWMNWLLRLQEWVQHWTWNGQCLHATGRAHFGHRRWKKNYIMYIVLDKLASHRAEIIKLIKGCNPLLMELRLLQPWFQTSVSTESIDLIIPRVRPPSRRSVSNRWTPSKNFSDPAMFR